MKTLLRILKWSVILILSLLLLLFSLLVLDSDYLTSAPELTAKEKQSIVAYTDYSSIADSQYYDQLLKEYGRNKKLAPGFEMQCLLALSHYPELKDVQIDFVLQPAFLPLASRPDPITIAFPWVQRKYLIVISTSSANFFEPILLRNTPFNEQVGIIGHELAHTLYYLDKSALQIAKIALSYQYNNDFRIKFERETDMRAIAHGLGYAMYDFAFFVRKAFNNTREEIESEEGDMYLSSKEIRNEMAQYSMYTHELPDPESYFE